MGCLLKCLFVVSFCGYGVLFYCAQVLKISCCELWNQKAVSAVHSDIRLESQKKVGRI